MNIDNLQEYQEYIVKDEDEWSELDKLCQITISRFYRDKMVFAFLERQVFPRLLNSIAQRQETELRIWCAGSGSGEEPYTLALIWAILFEPHYPDIKLSIIGTEINPELIKRAEQACYPYSAIKNLPTEWQESAFARHNDKYCLRNKYQHYLKFRCQDLRQKTPTDDELKAFHLICCRNLAFTYFDTSLQKAILHQLLANMVKNGVLMIGVHEKIPTGSAKFAPWSERLGIYYNSG